MAQPPPYPDTGDETRMGPQFEPNTSTPRWISVLGFIIAICLVLLVLVLHITGSIGPGAH